MQFSVCNGQRYTFIKPTQNIEDTHNTENTHHRRYSGYFGYSGLANSMQVMEARLVLKDKIVVQVHQDIQEKRRVHGLHRLYRFWKVLSSQSMETTEDIKA